MSIESNPGNAIPQESENKPSYLAELDKLESKAPGIAKPIKALSPDRIAILNDELNKVGWGLFALSSEEGSVEILGLLGSIGSAKDKDEVKALSKQIIQKMN